MGPSFGGLEPVWRFVHTSPIIDQLCIVDGGNVFVERRGFIQMIFRVCESQKKCNCRIQRWKWKDQCAFHVKRPTSFARKCMQDIQMQCHTRKGTHTQVKSQQNSKHEQRNPYQTVHTTTTKLGGGKRHIKNGVGAQNEQKVFSLSVTRAQRPQGAFGYASRCKSHPPLIGGTSPHAMAHVATRSKSVLILHNSRGLQVPVFTLQTGT